MRFSGKKGGDKSTQLAVALSMVVGVPMAVAMTLGIVLGSNVSVDLGVSLIVALVTTVTIPAAAAVSKKYCGKESGGDGRTGTRTPRLSPWLRRDDPLLIVLTLVLIATGVYILIAEFSEENGD